MKYWEALVEWESGGLGDVPVENMKEFYKQLQNEFIRRGYSQAGGFLKNPMSGDFIESPEIKN